MEKLARTVVVLLASAALPGSLLAQTAPQQQTSVPDQSGEQASEGALQDIVVTAQKRSENLQRVPIAVTAASGQDLVDRGVTNILQLNTIAPGVNMRTTTGAFQPSIRGIGTSSTVVENPVSLYIDGVYIPSQRDGSRNLADVEQIAVLKGPQGTLFGRNATGGVIQITTLTPTQETRASLGAEIDNYLTLKTRAYLAGGLADGLTASLSTSYATQGKGWGDNLTNGRETFRTDYDFGIRGKLRWAVGDDTNVTLIADYMNRRQITDSRQPYRGLPLQFPGTGPLGSVYDSYEGRQSFSAWRGGGVSLTIDHDLGFANLLSISAYRKGKANFLFDNSAVAQPFFIVRTPKSTNESYTQELQLVSPRSGPFEWMVGAFYIHDEKASDPFQRDFSGPFTPLPTSTLMNTTLAREVTESVAPFGQVSWEILPRLSLTGGIRWTYEKRSLRDASSTNLLVNGQSVTARFAPPSLTIRQATYRAAIDFQFSRNVLAYASFNTGIKSGGFNIVTPASPVYLPEELNAYEVGLKTELFGKRVRLNMAGYYYDYTNLQVIQFVGVTQTVVNGPGAKLYGLDVDLEAQLANGLRMTGGLNVAKNKFTDYKNAVFSQPRPTGGARIFSGDATGNRPPLAQGVSGTLALDYHQEVGSGSVDLNVTGNYNGDYFFEADNFLRQPDYVLLNSSLRWNLPGERISLTVFGRNLLNEKVITQAITQGLGYIAIYGNAPRTFGVGAVIKW